MKQRITFDSKEKRRDQRRPVSVKGSLGRASADLTNLSFTGVGGTLTDLRAATGLVVGEDAPTTLVFTGAGGQQVSLRATIQHINPETGVFGATFAALSSKQFDAIEKLMFPRRGGAKA